MKDFDSGLYFRPVYNKPHVLSHLRIRYLSQASYSSPLLSKDLPAHVTQTEKTKCIGKRKAIIYGTL